MGVAIGKMLLVAVGCGLVWLRGERLADIGLKRPESWTRALIIGVGLAAIVFVAIYLSERAGFRRDISKFKSDCFPARAGEKALTCLN
jgi:hypothetical protein